MNVAPEEGPPQPHHSCTTVEGDECVHENDEDKRVDCCDVVQREYLQHCGIWMQARWRINQSQGSICSDGQSKYWQILY